MKTLVNTLQNLLLVIVSAAAILLLAGAVYAQEPLEDPEFDPEIHIQPFQTSYLNQEIMPYNNANTGAATYAIPIKVPPGRRGVQPSLALSYNSRQKNGWVGMGWGLDLSAIQRSTKWGLDYSADAFSLNGAMELIPRSHWGVGYYETEIEDAFTKYYFDSETDRWVAYAKDGTRFYYGRTDNSRQITPDGVFQWCLDRVEDANGNDMTVIYTKDQGQIYPARIEYTDGSNSVEFTLENRPDTFTQYNTQSTVTTAKRLKQIDVYGNDVLAGTYVLSYELGPLTERSRLIQINENTRPPTVFSWQNGGNGTFDTAVETETGMMGAEDPRSYLADLNGDGRADLIRRSLNLSIQTYNTYLGRSDGSFGSANSNDIDVMPNEMTIIYFSDIDGDGHTDLIKRNTYNVFNVHLSRGDGFFDSPVETDLPVMIAEMGRIHFADINGDGRSDLILRTASNLFHVHLAYDDGTFGEAVETDLPVMSGEMGDIHFHDINGDNRADLIIRSTSGVFHTHFGHADGTLGSANSTDTGVMPSEMGLIYFADVNGDGITDLIKRNTGGTINTYPSLGDGTFGPHSSTETGVKPSESGYIDFTDVNGDGLADLVKHDRLGNYFAYLSKGDGTFGEERGTATGLMTYEKNQVYFADIDGDGLADLLKRNRAGTVHVHPATGRAADLLNTVAVSGDQDPQNGLVSYATYTYRASSHYENTLLPFVVQTLAVVDLFVSTNTEIGGTGQINSTTAYTYAGGYYDAEDREFRGFQQTIQSNPDETTVTRQFHQDDYFKGKEASSEVKDSAGTALLETTFTWGLEFLNPPDNTIAFVHLDRRHTDIYDNPTVYRWTDYTYDSQHGSLLTAVSSGTDAESITSTSQYQDYGPDKWLWRTTRETLTGSQTGKVRETYYEYDSDTGNLLAAESWLDGGTNPIITMAYGSYGNPVTVTDARGQTTTMQYDLDTQTYPVKITSPPTNGVSHVIEYPDYDYRWGKVKTAIDENGQTTDYSYDELGRLVTVDYPDGGQVQREYYDHENPRRAVTRVKEDANYSMDSYAYFDGLLRQISTVTLGESVNGSPRIIQSDWFYDEMGRGYLSHGPLFQGEIAEFPWQRTDFDDLGRPVQIERPDPEYSSVFSTLDYRGFDVTVTDPDGASKTEIKDYLGRVIAVIEHAAEGDQTTTYAYNAAGDLLTVTDHYGNQIRMDYDTLGRRIQLDDPDLGVWTYSYDANGNLITQSDYKSQDITFAYDELNRVTSKSYSNADPAVTYSYDNLSIDNGRGRLYSVTNTLVTDTINGYDPMGRQTSVGKTITGGETVYTTGYRYDLAGKLTRLTYPDNYQLDYTYYPGSGLAAYAAGFDLVTYAFFSDYTAGGQVGQIQYGGQSYANYVSADQYSYNRQTTRLETITTRAIGGSDYLQWFEYKYTPAGDIKEKTDIARGNTYTYTYDKLHRLVEELAEGYLPPLADTTYDYTYDDTYQPHAVKQIALNGSAPFDYTYDDNGNMQTGPDFSNPAAVTGRTITYDADNMPLSIEHGSGVTTEFVYDGAGARAKKRVLGGSATYYIGDHYEIKDGVATRYIFAGKRRIAKRTANEIYYYHKDHLGSSTVMTDASAGQVEYSDYLPFGHQREHSGTSVTNYKYTDQELDVSTGLYNYDARLYDPVIGRFISADSIVQDLYDPQLLNRYSYVRNNPLKYVDPDGHAVETAWDAFNIALGVQSFGSNIRSGNYGAAAVDAVGTIIDTAAAAIPFVPGGAGTAIKVIRGADKAIDSANIARKSKKILDASNNGSSKHIYRTGSQTDNALTDASGVSFRDSVSSAADGSQVFRPNDKIYAVDVDKLPHDSVKFDGGIGNTPHGHVSVKTTPDQIRAATVPVSPENPLSGLLKEVKGSTTSYKLPK
jgi:RHS repeat-associated protein